MIIVGAAITAQQGVGEDVPNPISAVETPQIQPVADGDTWADLLLASATDTANYDSTAGAIVSAVAEVSIDGGAWTALAGNEATVLNVGESVQARVTAADDQDPANERVFNAGSTVVAAAASGAFSSAFSSAFDVAA